MSIIATPAPAQRQPQALLARNQPVLMRKRCGALLHCLQNLQALVSQCVTLALAQQDQNRSVQAA